MSAVHEPKPVAVPDRGARRARERIGDRDTPRSLEAAGST